jgi:hypothetical protein
MPSPIAATSGAVPVPVESDRDRQGTASHAQAQSAPGAVAGAPPDPTLVPSLVESETPQVTLGGRTIEFSFDEEINRVVVRVRSTETDEIVRQIPPEEYMRFRARFRETIGVIFDEVA